jgi:signal transduction histidine kinase
MAMLFGVALEHETLEARIQAVSPILLTGRLASGFGHEVYNKMSGLEIQLRNLQTDCGRLYQQSEQGLAIETPDLGECNQAVDRLLDLALDLKETVELFRELMQAPAETKVNVNHIVRRAIEFLQPLARRQRINVETRLADLPLIGGSALRLQQIFANLLLNAIQQTAEKMARWADGRGELHVETAWEPERERPIVVRVRDNGPGIHYRLWENIFGLGFSTRPGGTGLGLYIAQSLAESMNGRIQVEQSTVPTGTTFRVELAET